VPIGPEQFEERGFGRADATSRAALVALATDALASEPRWTWFVPGRIEVFGKHTDYAGGRSLVAAVPRGFAVVASPRDDAVVRVIDARYGGSVAVDPGKTAREYRGWHRYVAVVARRLARNFPRAALGIDIALASDLPRAAGVSSSSALVVGLATALIERAALRGRTEWRVSIRTTEDLAGYLGAVENGLTFGSLASVSGVGTHGGSEDHTAILACHGGQVSAFAYVPVVHQGDAAMPEDWRFLVVSSGIEADKAGGARDRYNRASLATKALLELWTRECGAARTLAAALASSPRAEDALRQLVARSTHPDFSADELSRRLSHFRAEDARVPAALSAFRDEDAERLKDLATGSQGDAERWLGNQIPETSALVTFVRQAGAFAATSFGAGFGGSVWALARSEEASGVLERAVSRYQTRYSGTGRVASFIARPSPALLDLSSFLSGR
jgi:galactokinase